MTNDTQERDLTDGFNLVIDALKLNDIDTIFGLPGIPITDFTRKAQAEGIRVISFRHEQHAGNAAAAAGFLTGKPGIVMMSPHTTTTNPAPAASRTSRIFSRWPLGAPRNFASLENEYCVFAMQTGRCPYPSASNCANCKRTLASAVIPAAE